METFKFISYLQDNQGYRYLLSLIELELTTLDQTNSMQNINTKR